MKTARPFCFPWWVFIQVFEQVLIIHFLCFPQILSISASKVQVRELIAALLECQFMDICHRSQKCPDVIYVGNDPAAGHQSNSIILKGEEGNTPECVVRSGRILMEKKGSHRKWKTSRDLESARRWQFRYFGFRIKIGPWELNWALSRHFTVSSSL